MINTSLIAAAYEEGQKFVYDRLHDIAKAELETFLAFNWAVGTFGDEDYLKRSLAVEGVVRNIVHGVASRMHPEFRDIKPFNIIRPDIKHDIVKDKVMKKTKKKGKGRKC